MSCLYGISLLVSQMSFSGKLVVCRLKENNIILMLFDIHFNLSSLLTAGASFPWYSTGGRKIDTHGIPGKRALVYREQLTMYILIRSKHFFFTAVHLNRPLFIENVFYIHVAFWIVDRCLCSPMPSFKTLWA